MVTHQMACKVNYANLPILTNSSTINQQQQYSILKCRAQTPPAGATGTTVYRAEFRTLEACKLGISRYPDFDYNAKGGIGTGIGRQAIGIDDDEEISVSFDVETLYIPALTGATTRFLGLPLPPFLKIEVVPEVLDGKICRTSGKVDLQFKATFVFSVGKLYKAPPLMVETTLTSEESSGTLRAGKGERLNEEGRCRLVGVATVDPINDLLMDSFLSLPTECIAILNANISITTLA